MLCVVSFEVTVKLMGIVSLERSSITVPEPVIVASLLTGIGCMLILLLFSILQLNILLSKAKSVSDSPFIFKSYINGELSL